MVAGEEGQVENYLVGHRLPAFLASELELPKRALGITVYWDPTEFERSLGRRPGWERQNLARHGVEVAYARGVQAVRSEMESLMTVPGFHMELAEGPAVEASALDTAGMEIQC